MSYLKDELYQLIRKDSEVFEFLQNSALDGLWYWDLENMEEEWMNEKFWITLGYNPKEMPHKASAWQHIINPEDLKIAEQTVGAHLADPSVKYDQIVRYTHKKGHTVWIRCRGMAIRNEQGVPLRMLGAHTEITELKEREAELEEMLRITKDQNERLKNFAYIVSHNLRSHSSNIGLLSGLIKRENNNDSISEHIRLLSKSSENLTETIAYLQEIVSININTNDLITDVDLSKAVNQVIENFEIEANETGVKLINETEDNLKIKGVNAYIESILYNFVSNGIKYRSHEKDSFLRISSEQNDKFTTLHFQDNGLGIDLNKYGEKLFGMYKTFHRVENAKGIGLFISKNQIDAMGGNVEVESQVGEGSTFKISFRK